MIESADDDPDLWVEPHRLTPEDIDEIRRYIRKDREEHPLTEGEKEAIQTLVRSLRREPTPVPDPDENPRDALSSHSPR